jgi:hypothetical protein
LSGCYFNHIASVEDSFSAEDRTHRDRQNYDEAWQPEASWLRPVDRSVVRQSRKNADRSYLTDGEQG